MTPQQAVPSRVAEESRRDATRAALEMHHLGLRHVAIETDVDAEGRVVLREIAYRIPQVRVRAIPAEVHLEKVVSQEHHLDTAQERPWDSKRLSEGPRCLVTGLLPGAEGKSSYRLVHVVSNPDEMRMREPRAGFLQVQLASARAAGSPGGEDAPGAFAHHRVIPEVLHPRPPQPVRQLVLLETFPLPGCVLPSIGPVNV